jgi:hypothetical protein
VHHLPELVPTALEEVYNRRLFVRVAALVVATTSIPRHEACFLSSLNDVALIGLTCAISARSVPMGNLPAIEKSAPINEKIWFDESVQLARYTIDSCAGIWIETALQAWRSEHQES